MPKQRVKTEQEKEKKRHCRMNRRYNLANVGAIVGQVGTQGETLGTIGWIDGLIFSRVRRVAEEEQRRQ
jgi:hypothetical protein